MAMRILYVPSLARVERSMASLIFTIFESEFFLFVLSAKFDTTDGGARR